MCQADDFLSFKGSVDSDGHFPLPYVLTNGKATRSRSRVNYSDWVDPFLSAVLGVGILLDVRLQHLEGIKHKKIRKKCG